MQKTRESLRKKGILWSLLFSLIVLAVAAGICLLLSQVDDDNNPFAMAVFILAVVVVASHTDGYWYGIFSACAGVLCVNYFFTQPFFQFEWSIAGYPLTFTAMLLVSLIVSTLTTQIKKQEQLRFDVETEKMRVNLLRSLSHDLRTPLASILGASSVLLEQKNLSLEERDELAQDIQKEAHWLSRVTENILSVTKFSGSGVALKKEEEVLEEIVSSAIVKFRRHHPEVAVTVERPENILLAPMDATLIEQVLTNLFENAAIHGKNATVIRVTISQEPGRAAVTVEDNGAGFSPEALEHIFDGLQPASVTHSDNRRNMGIGLNVCRSIIRAHGGDIAAENRQGGGAAIRFWLPREEEEEHGE